MYKKKKKKKKKKKGFLVQMYKICLPKTLT